jgi:DNA-binding transcriptional ArsR family regulator
MKLTATKINKFIKLHGRNPTYEENCAMADGKEPEDLGGDVRGNGNGYSLLCLNDVISKPVNYLSYPYKPKGKLISLVGEPDTGKTTLELKFAADMSRGRAYPGAEAGPPKTILLASAEDGLSDTIRPRLEAMDADLARIHAITGALDFADDGVDILERCIAEKKPDMVIIDPLMAFVGLRTDVYRPNVVRVIMAKLADVAERYGCVIVSIRHLSKAQVRKPIHAGLGSIDFSAACRSVLLVGSDPDNPSKKAMVHIKSNLAPKGSTMGFELVNNSLNWTGTSDLTAERILGLGYQKDLRQQEADNKALDVISILGKADVNTVVKELGLHRTTVQNRLHALREAGLLTCKADGKRIVYSLPIKEPVAIKTTPLQDTNNNNTLQPPTIPTYNNNILQDKHVEVVMCSGVKSKATDTKPVTSPVTKTLGFQGKEGLPCYKDETGNCALRTAKKSSFTCAYEPVRSDGGRCYFWRPKPGVNHDNSMSALW